MDKKLMALLKTACNQEPDQGLLEVIGSCFSGGDLSHISDEELKENLQALIEVNMESKSYPRKKTVKST